MAFTLSETESKVHQILINRSFVWNIKFIPKKYFPPFHGGPLDQKISAFFPFWSFKSQLHLHTYLWLTLYTRWSQVFMLSRLSFPTTSFSELKWSGFLNGFDGNLRRPSNMVFYQWKMHLNEWKIWAITLINFELNTFSAFLNSCVEKYGDIYRKRYIYSCVFELLCRKILIPGC